VTKRLRIPMSKKSKGVSIPEDIYLAEITDIEKDKGKYGPQLRWKFKIIKGKQKGTILTAWTQMDARPKNKLGRWLKKLIPDLKFKEGKFDIGDLIGDRCRISVVHTDAVNDDGSPKCKVDEIFKGKKKRKDDDEEEERPKKKKKKGKKKKRREEEEEDDEEEEDEEDEDDEDDDDDEDDEDEDDEDDDDDDEDDEEDEEDEDDEEEEERPRKRKKKKGKDKGKKKKKKKRRRDDDEEDEDDDLSW